MSRRGRGRRAARRALAAGLATVLAVALGSCGGDRGQPADETVPAGPVATPPEATSARLYFPSASGFLTGEERRVEPSTDVRERIERLVTALLEGPAGGGLFRSFPEGTRVGSVFLALSGIAYVDLLSEEGARPPRSGSRSEMLSVYSLVNTVLLDQPDLDGVVLLWNGQQPATFAGHLDTARPLRADDRWLAR